nr:hypothetical protein [Tanacetum cinerariifolium]
MLKYLERFWISIQELKVKNSLSYKMMTIPLPSSLTLATKVHFTSTPAFRVLLDVHQETVDDSEESKPKPEPIKKKTASKRVVKKKVTISTYDNIILDPDISLELGKSIDLAKSKEEEAAKQVHATHARIMTEFVPESAKKKTGSRSSRSVVIQDTSSALKPKLSNSKAKLKGVQYLTLAEKEAADITQALKESKKTSKRQPGTRGLSEGTSTIPGVITKEKVILEWGSKQESKYSEEDQLDDEEKDDKEGDADDEGNDHISDTQDTNAEDGETKSDEDEIYKKGDTKMSDVTKADAEMTEETNNDSKKDALPPTSSTLSISLSFGDQFLKVSSDTSLIGTVKDTTDAKITSLLYIKIQSKVLHIQSPSALKVPMFVISEPLVLIPIQETPLAAHVTTLPPLSISTIPPTPLQQTTTPIPSPPITTDTPTITTAIPKSDTLLAIQLRVINLEKDVSELKKIHHSAKSLATLKSQVLMVVQQYLGSKIGDDLQKGKKTKRRRTKESESSKNPSTTKETPKGKAPSKCSKTSKSASTNEPVEEPIAEVVIDDAGEDVVCDDDQPQDTFEPKTAKTPNLEWIRSHSTISCPLLLTSLSHPGHLTIAAEYFFNNDLEYLKSLDPERTYTTSIRKTKAAWFEIVGVIYEDLAKQKRVMRADELYMFSNGTLKKVWDLLHYRILNFCLGYNNEMSKRKWTTIDKKRSNLMVKLIDKQTRERRIIRNLERLVDARELKMDYKQMTRTVYLSGPILKSYLVNNVNM